VGLFSFVGKALKGISKVAGFIPGVGGTISKVAKLGGNLLDRKRPMASGPVQRNPMIARGNTTQGNWNGFPASVLRQTPVMPGGAISGPSGIMPSTGAAPPMMFGRSAGKAIKRKRRKPAAARRRTSSRKRSSRRLKFGSPAWRKKYMRRR
jgi:hypothetical protein